MGSTRSGALWKCCSKSSLRTSTLCASGLCFSFLYSTHHEAFIPKLPCPVMQPCANLGDDFMRQVSRTPCSFVCRKAVRDAVKEGAREHVAGPGQILRFSRKRWDVRFETIMPDVGAVRAVRHNHGRDSPVKRLESFLGAACLCDCDCLAFIAEEQIRLFECLIQCVAENLRNKSVGTRDGDL